MILEVDQVSQHFGELYACKDVSFQVQTGEVFGIAGPNGAGKTTLFNCIAGAYHPSQGRIVFDGERVDRLPPHRVCHRGIARTHQIPTVFHSMTLRDNVKVGAHFGKKTRRNEKGAVADALEFVELSDKGDLRGDEINLYDKKRTMLAAALATGPRLLLLDEPVGGLSPQEIPQLVTLIKRVNTELGITLLVIEHLMKVLIDLSGRMLILNNGEVIALGEPDSVCSDERVVSVYIGAGGGRC